MRIAARIDRAANLPTQDQASDATRAVQPDWGPRGLVCSGAAPGPRPPPLGSRALPYRSARRTHCALARPWPPAHASRPALALLARSGPRRRDARRGPFPAPWFCGLSPRLGARRRGAALRCVGLPAAGFAVLRPRRFTAPFGRGTGLTFRASALGRLDVLGCLRSPAELRRGAAA